MNSLCIGSYLPETAGFIVAFVVSFYGVRGQAIAGSWEIITSYLSADTEPLSSQSNDLLLAVKSSAASVKDGHGAKHLRHLGDNQPFISRS